MPRPDVARRKTSRAVWQRRLLPFLLALVFAAPILGFANLQHFRDALPPGSTPNDGTRASFFVLNARPFAVFAEDFHLYVVRGKRIAERGFVGDLLGPTDQQETVTTAPLQAGLGYLAYLTGGAPLPYALFLFTLVAVSWSSLLGTSVVQLRRFYGLWPILAVALVAAIFQSPTKLVAFLGGFLPLPGGNDIWPGYKAMRFSTQGWSQPLFLAHCIMMARATVGGRITRPVALGSGLILLLFALGDLWALILGLGVTGLTLLADLLRRRLRPDIGWIALAAAAAVSALLFLLLKRPEDPDAVARGGIGPIWRVLPGGVSWDVPTIGFLAASGGFAVIAVAALFYRNRPAMRTAVAICALPLAATLVLMLGFAATGAEAWQLKQFHDRTYGALLLAVLLIAVNVLRRFGLGARTTGVLLVLFLALHTARTHVYLTRVAAPDLALTRDLEGLEPILKGARCGSLATLSHEVNYLAAVWTRCDLLLPEGFPLHFSGSDAVIAARTGGLLKFYNVDPAAWRAFNLDQPSSGQTSWLVSRVLAERQGYTYFLRHRRYAGFAPDWTGEAPSPDVLVLDPVSQQLGRPDLAHYQRVGASGPYEVWRRTP